jgi:adenylyltransferase/sulfurtransferase
MSLQRYSRQIAYQPLGEAGQRKLLGSRVAIAGMGALGSVVANNLCRAGVGYLRLIDRDLVELSNIQRQVLYNEEDARNQVPKAIAAYEHLHSVNSEIKIVPIVTDINSGNIEELVKDVDLVIDGSDNYELRVVLNEVCDKLAIPWIYGGALGGEGATMNIVPGGPCFKCLAPATPETGSYPTCSSAGALNMATGMIACYESAEAIKILTGSDRVSSKYLTLDVWNNASMYLEFSKNPDCPVCVHKQYEYLGKVRGTMTTSLCGQDSVQVVPAKETAIDFLSMQEKLQVSGEVRLSEFMLSFENETVAFNLFLNGRAIIKNTDNPSVAKSVYSEYIGL